MKTLIISLNAIIIIGLIPMSSAYLSDSIGVQLSQTCVSMIKANLETNCPTYEEIILLFPDTSDQRVSGQFVYEDYYKRAESPIKNEFRFYEYDKESRVFVDPAADIASRVKLIIIESRIDEYKLPNQVITEGSIDVGHQRYVNPGCYEAHLSATDWQFLLGDTMLYMKHDCDPSKTNFNSVKTKTWERVVHDIKTSYKYFLDNWYKAAIEKCGKRVCFYE